MTSHILDEARLDRYEMITGGEAREKILSILKASDVGRLALLDRQYPYIIAMNHFLYKEGLVMHGSFEGKKIELIKRNKYAGYEVDFALEEGLPGLKSCHREFESAVFYGEIREITDSEERYDCLHALSASYGMPFKHGAEERCNALFFRIHEATARTGRFIPHKNKKLYYYDFR